MLYFLEPKLGRFTISVPAKAGCTSMKWWLHQMHFGEPKVPVLSSIIHRIMGRFQVSGPLPDHTVNIAIHRDPQERICSYYRDKKVKQPFENWLTDLPRLLYDNDDVRLHLPPQAKWLGGRLDAYDIVLPTSRFAELPGVLSKVLGVDLPPMPLLNKTAPVDIEMSDLSKRLLMAFAQVDYTLGWDGLSAILPDEHSNQ